MAAGARFMKRTGCARAPLYVIPLALFLLLGCSRPTAVALPPAGRVASLEVRSTVGSEPTRGTRTSDPTAIRAALHAIARLNSDWRAPSGTYPTPRYSVSFRSSGGTVLAACWIGDDWLGCRAIDEAPDVERLRSLTAAQQSALLRVLGVQ